MARIRSIKPEFWDDRKLARSTSRDARMLYMGMWNQSDEHGRLNGDAVWIKGRVFPYEEDIGIEQIKLLLDELVSAGRIQRYQHDGDPFIYLPKLGKHQRLEPGKVESRLPEPPPETRTDEYARRADEYARDSDIHSEPVLIAPEDPCSDESARGADSSSLLYVAGSREQGAGGRGQGGAARTAQRGTRLNENWQPSDADRAWTLERVTGHVASVELEKFRNYWLAKTGKDATKLDWSKTWRNWVLNARPSPQQPAPATSKAQSYMDLIDDEGANR